MHKVGYSNQKMLKLKLSSKILVYFLLVSLVPLVVTNFFLVTSANTQLLKAASTKQQAVANYLSDRVGSYLSNNTKSLVYLSQIYSAGNLSGSDIDQNMAVLFNQNTDLQRLAIVNTSGKEQKVFDSHGKISTLADTSGTDAFKAVNFLSGKDYISSVSYNEQNDPIITIAVPVLSSNFSQHLNNLGAADFGSYRKPDDIKGAVIANYNIKNLWQSVLSTKIGQGGYAYVVDGFGNLVAHPDNGFLTSHQKLSDVAAAKQFISGNFDTHETTSEIGQKVVSTPQLISNSGWAVIVEEPVSSIYSGVNSYIQRAAIIGLSAIALAVLVSIFFRRQLIGPIKKLSLGAKRIGSGDFDHTIDIKSNDELQDLADTFNSMSLNIQKLVSELQANNLNLITEKSKLDNIIRSVTDGIVALNANGEIVSINPPAAALASQKAEDLIGKKLNDVFAWQQDDKRLILELSEPGTHQYSEISLRYSDKTAYLDIVASVINQKDSDVASIITIHDLTKSRELDFMKLDFVAIAAHELRTPLTVVRGYLDMLNTDAIKQMSVFNIESLQKAILGANQLRDLINKLLNIARIERGEMEIFIEKLDLAKLVKENVHQHQPTATQNEQKLTFEANTEGPVYVPADPSSIIEVLNNLLGNALKFTGPRGEVHVHLEAGPDEVRVQVSDNGPGIPTALRDKLFTKFYRAERSLISGTRGTGLGLFISRTIIELQKGKIGIEPAAKKGSTFFFTLPIYKAEIHDTLVNKDKQSGGVRGWFKKNTNSRR